MGKSWEEDVLVVGNIAEVAGIQTDDSPVDAQIGSWVVDYYKKIHACFLWPRAQPAPRIQWATSSNRNFLNGWYMLVQTKW